MFFKKGADGKSAAKKSGKAKLPASDGSKNRFGRRSIATLWLRNSLGVVIAVLIVIGVLLGVLLKNYYYGSARQYLTSRMNIITNTLQNGVRDGSVAPVLCGSAISGLGVDMLISPDAHANHLSLELEAGRVLRTARAHPVLQPKRVAGFE